MTLTGSGGNATVDTSGGDIGLSGVLNGAGGLAKIGGNTLSLSGNNGYTGGTTISGGVLQLGNNSALGLGLGAAHHQCRYARPRRLLADHRHTGRQRDDR